jgi:uncharacterized protein DUF4129
MKHSNIAVTAMLLALVLLCRVPPAQAESVSISQYRQQLHGIATKVDALGSHPDEAGELVASIPDHVSVATSTGEISVSYKTLKDNLAAFAAADESKRPGLLTQIQSYTRELLAAADGYEKRHADLSSTHRQLEQILSRHEFKKVRGPSAKDAFLARVYRWLSRLLSKISLGTGTQFDWMRLLIYLLIGAAVALLSIWTIRRMRRPQEDLPQREIIPFSPSARGWRTWLAEARALAQQQDWRNAIHLAYWAGISYLEEHGAWKPNRARTPREYLRLIGTRAAQYPVLAALTRKLEVVWYGYGSAAEADFQETLGQLEKLGCR